MVSINRFPTALNQETIDKLIDTTITKHGSSEKLVKNIEQEELLKSMSNNLRILKEQNDEIIGDEFN